MIWCLFSASVIALCLHVVAQSVLLSAVGFIVSFVFAAIDEKNILGER